MCNYTYHHGPTCGHIASFNVDTCTAFTSSLRIAESDSDQQPTSCTKTVHSHSIVSPTSPSLCFQCEQEWMERAKNRVKAMALGETLLGEYEEEQSEFVQLEGLDCPPKVGMTFTFPAPKGKEEKKKLIGLGIAMDGGVQCNDDNDAETDIFIDAGVDYFISGDDDGPESDYEDANEHATDEDGDGESCPTNSPFASQGSSFLEQRQYFDFYFDYKNSPIPEEYVHVSAVDDESSGDEDIELFYLDYPNAAPDHGKLLHDLDSSSDSFENIEYFDLSPTSSHLQTSFLDLGDEENMQLVAGTPRSPRTKEFKELEENVGDAAQSVTGLLGRVYNGLPEILPKVTVMGRINRVFGR